MRGSSNTRMLFSIKYCESVLFLLSTVVFFNRIDACVCGLLGIRRGRDDLTASAGGGRRVLHLFVTKVLFLYDVVVL